MKRKNSDEKRTQEKIYKYFRKNLFSDSIMSINNV